MIKCANCTEEAHYTVSQPGVNSVDYCNKHVPLHLKPLAAAGRYPLRKEATKKKKASPKPEPVEEPVEEVVEEAKEIVEELPEETTDTVEE
jgi:hypothetical protein